ncbi:Phage integrase family protein [Streptomyces sp. ScaeMP-e48]|uniref:tyrosine-type recombinase/integrase n=1 Tax=Streptomyces sp. ScaeMP-e48 TaxID=1100823 RepID=UPI000823E7D7|nr:site-specific integrase [Streptomyces sp. ScaeMP-e48]SCK20500.1 Phage integrase family protein [Streptomyces sp. ScaeMP-e48]
MARKPLNNPRQIRSKNCGCTLCLEEYPPAEHGDRKARRDCIGSWQARYRDPTGKQKARNFKKKTGDDGADAFLDKIRTAVRDRTYRDPKRGKITLAAWWGEWWEVQQRKGRVTTRNRKLGVWKTYISKKWGGYQLIDLEYMELQRWLSRDVKGYESQKRVREVLLALLDAAIKDGERISVNPALHLEITAERVVKHPDDLKPPTEAQYALIHVALPAYYQVILRDFAHETGMRPGEYAGLREHCVDEEEMLVHIKEILILDGGKLRRQAAPKTKAGFRTVPLTPRAFGGYLFMKEMWQPHATRSRIGDGFDLHVEELVFRGPQGAALNINNLSQRVWRKAIIQAGVARKIVNPETGHHDWWPRVYEYRHLVTTRLHHAGISEKDTQSVLGQERGGRVTWVYTHESEGARESVRAALTGRSGLHVVPDGETA